jgi:iron-sulfur cluster repair protein YtfE (RIC family)
MSNELWEALKIVLSFIFGGLGIKIFDKYSNKSKENLEKVKLYQEGTNLQIQVRTNIDKVVEEKTRELNTQIGELKDTIVHISTRYRNDLDKYMDRMVDLEKKFDEQLARNQEMETRLTSQIKIRQECLDELEDLKSRMNAMERKNP